jgi:hypothetical protein
MHNIEFDHFRPIYISFIIILTILLIYIFMKNRFEFIDGFVITSISLTCLIVSIYMTSLVGTLTDELSMGGDSVSFYLFIITASMSVINFVAYFNRKRS